MSSLIQKTKISKKKEGGFMLVGLRVDHRLLHGQVAFSWTSALGADCILIANTAVGG